MSRLAAVLGCAALACMSTVEVLPPQRDASASAPACTGMTCVCPSGASCDLSRSSCGGAPSCSLDCEEKNRCTGTCGHSCSIDCAGGSTCEVTVGPSGSVTCEDGSVCRVTCTDECSLSCSDNSQCELRCAGQTAPQPRPSGGSCP